MNEQRTLEALGARVAARPLRPVDAFRLRRTRQRLLATWNDGVLDGERTHRGARAWLFAFGGAVLLVASTLLVLRKQPGQSFVKVEARPGAHWAEQRTPAAYRIALRDGIAWFTVRADRQQPVFVDVPDGVIEDRGTVFEVEVRARHTTRVVVREGRVLVRLDDQPSFELAAGQTWNAPEAPAVPPPAPRLEPSSAAVIPSAAPALRTPTRRKAAPSTPPRTFDSAEDDAYLRIVDLLRNGHTADARAQAQQYLARFPNGFRRPEVAEIAR